MGLFQQLPEEPTEWAGLPSEPLQPETAAQRLDAGAGLDPTALPLGSGGSIAIPITPPADAAPEQGVIGNGTDQ